MTKTNDPTWIPVELDPREQRMRGIARHGNTPFDCPIISRIAGNLYQGGCQTGLMLPKEIEHVVSLYKWESYRVKHELKSSLTITMYDSEDQGFEQVEALARWVYDCTKDGPTLVHCQAGLNRSGLVAGRVLMLDGLSADEAISILRGTRSPAVLCNKSFENYLRSKDLHQELIDKVVAQQRAEQDAGL